MSAVILCATMIVSGMENSVLFILIHVRDLAASQESHLLQQMINPLTNVRAQSLLAVIFSSKRRFSPGGQ